MCCVLAQMLASHSPSLFKIQPITMSEPFFISTVDIPLRIWDWMDGSCTHGWFRCPEDVLACGFSFSFSSWSSKSIHPPEDWATNRLKILAFLKTCSTSLSWVSFLIIIWLEWRSSKTARGLTGILGASWNNAWRTLILVSSSFLFVARSSNFLLIMMETHSCSFWTSSWKDCGKSLQPPLYSP